MSDQEMAKVKVKEVLRNKTSTKEQIAEAFSGYFRKYAEIPPKVRIATVYEDAAGLFGAPVDKRVNT